MFRYILWKWGARCSITVSSSLCPVKFHNHTSKTSYRFSNRLSADLRCILPVVKTVRGLNSEGKKKHMYFMIPIWRTQTWKVWIVKSPSPYQLNHYFENNWNPWFVHSWFLNKLHSVSNTSPLLRRRYSNAKHKAEIMRCLLFFTRSKT